MTSKSHGGAGRGQGRKKAVAAALERCAAGSKCEELWNELMVRQALAKYELDPATKMIRLAQNRTSLIPLRDRTRRSTNETLDDVGSDIEAALELRTSRDRGNASSLCFEEGRSARQLQIPLVRPKNAKAQIIEEAISWFKDTYGIELTPYRMRRCWDEFRAASERLKQPTDQHTG
jgi:hypothetical protein